MIVEFQVQLREHGFKLPLVSDYLSALHAIIRLQRVYQLDVNDWIEGKRILTSYQKMSYVPLIELRVIKNKYTLD